LERLPLSRPLKKDNMLTEKEIGTILAAQLMSAVRNNDYAYVSGVSAHYSHLKDPGKKIMAELTELMFTKAVELDKQRRQNDAEQLVMDNIKK
jgi:hypothetical protein